MSLNHRGSKAATAFPFLSFPSEQPHILPSEMTPCGIHNISAPRICVPWLSCHLPLPFTALDAAEPCLLHSAAPTAAMLLPKNSRCCTSLPIVKDYCLPFLFFMNCHLKKIYVTVPWAVIRSWAGCARLEGKTQTPNCSNNHNVVGVFLTTRSEELCIFCAVKCPLQFSLRQVRVSALWPETRAIQHQAGNLQQSWEENPGFLTPYSY